MESASEIRQKLEISICSRNSKLEETETLVVHLKNQARNNGKNLSGSNRNTTGLLVHLFTHTWFMWFFWIIKAVWKSKVNINGFLITLHWLDITLHYPQICLQVCLTAEQYRHFMIRIYNLDFGEWGRLAGG